MDHIISSGLRYTESQLAERDRIVRLIEEEKRIYQERIQPYIEALVAIDNQATPYLIMAAP